MPQGEYSHEHPVTVHEGPMADKRGTSWRKDAIRLETLNAEQIQNPWQTVPNSLTSMDKEHAAFGKTDDGTFDKTENGRGGDDTRA